MQESGDKLVPKLEGADVVPGVRDEVKFQPKGSSITLYGAGDRTGRDVLNAMGLEEAYRVVLGC
jgi:hypothetical protein